MSSASRVSAGTWVYLEKEYKQLSRRYRAEKGRSAGPPLVPDRLVVATHPLDGQQQVVAFSDGTSDTWYRTSNVMVTQMDEPRWLGEVEEEEGAVVAFERIIEILYEEGLEGDVKSIFDRLDRCCEEDLERALDAAI